MSLTMHSERAMPDKIFEFLRALGSRNAVVSYQYICFNVGADVLESSRPHACSMDHPAADPIRCYGCGTVDGFENGGDGFFYCSTCGLQSTDLFDTLLQAADEAAARPSPKPITDDAQHKCSSKQRPYSFGEGGGVSVPEDFGRNGGWGQAQLLQGDVVAKAIRDRYVMGLQVMVNKQCEELVKFGVCPVICGVVGPLWLRYVVASGVCREGWADEAIVSSQARHESKHGDKEVEPNSMTAKNKSEPQNLYGQRASRIWLKSLKMKLPMCSTLAICFLACHVAREAVLPNDILKWALEGKLFYLTARRDIEKYIGSPEKACPVTSRTMFTPSLFVGNWLEPMAGSIASQIRLHLPPVNFRLMVARFITALDLPMVKNVLQHACRIYEWLMPPELWLSADEGRMSTQTCVVSILVVAIRILYSIHGFGMFEMRLSGKKMSQESLYAVTRPSLVDCMVLIFHLDNLYYKRCDEPAFSKDLASYLAYCSDVVFAGTEASYEDELIASNLWYFRRGTENAECCHSDVSRSDCWLGKRVRADGEPTKESNRASSVNVAELAGDCSFVSRDTREEDSIEQILNANFSLESDQRISLFVESEPLVMLKAEMEENGFSYMPPRKYDGKQGNQYLPYHQVRSNNMSSYVAHADYYLLLRACAKLVKVEVKTLHKSVLKLEERLSRMEGEIDKLFSK